MGKPPLFETEPVDRPRKKLSAFERTQRSTYINAREQGMMRKSFRGIETAAVSFRFQSARWTSKCVGKDGGATRQRRTSSQVQ